MTDHLSYSSISMYLACPESWRRKYVAKETTFTTPALVFGSAIHNTVEHYVQNHDSILKVWGAEWQKAISGARVAWGMDSPDQYYREGIDLLSEPKVMYGLNAITPASVERKVELNVTGVPIPIIGYIDVITTDGIPGDFKTSAKAWTSDRAEAEMQPLFYLAALNQIGEHVPGLKFRHYVMTKRPPSFKVFETAHKPGEVLFLHEVIRKVWQGIEREVFPLNPTSWKCNAQFCDFWSKCRGRY